MTGLQAGNMQYRSTPRTSGVVVDALDLTVYRVEALDRLKERRPDREVLSAGFGSWDRLARVETKDGRLFVLCDEGVAVQVTTDDPLQLDVFGKYAGEEPNQTLIDLMPVGNLTLDLYEVMALPVLAQINLANYVRVFGDRLEQNFDILNREFSS